MVLTAVIFIVLLLIGSAHVTLWKDFKYYRTTYNALASGEFKCLMSYDEDMYIFLKNPANEKEELSIQLRDNQSIDFLVKRNSVKLLGTTAWLSRSVIEWLSPYTIYWNYKILGWIKKNKHTIDQKSSTSGS